MVENEGVALVRLMSLPFKEVIKSMRLHASHVTKQADLNSDMLQDRDENRSSPFLNFCGAFAASIANCNLQV